MAKRINVLPTDPNFTLNRLLFSGDPTTGKLYKVDYATVLDALTAPLTITITSNAVYNIPAGYILDMMTILPVGASSLKIGFTSDGDEIMPQVNISAGQVYPVTYKIPAPTSVPIYFSNITSTTKISFYLKKL